MFMKTTRTFQDYYEIFYPDVSARENFKEGHKIQLEVLCRLYVDLQRLTDFIDKSGYTYVSEGRNGIQEKVRPEVAQRNAVLSEIRNYSRMLGLVLVKDKATKDDKEEKEFD
jgi:hypothetical protein